MSQQQPRPTRSAALTYSSDIEWTSGEKFEGYVLLGIAMPEDADDEAWPTMGRVSDNPQTRLPLWIPVPVTNGQYNDLIKVIWNEDIDPPNTKYAAYWYDLSGKLVNTDTPALFVIDEDPYTLAPPTLTSPTAAVTPPTPQS